jgi:Fe-S-cluster containining protein
MVEEVDSCKMCGRCCHFEIPITLLDIHRMAKLLNVSDSQAFQEYIQHQVSPHSSLYMIRKDAHGACIFLTQDNKCSIHEAKPRGCAFYLCTRSNIEGGTDILPWTATCTDPPSRALLWEQAIAASLTGAYIKNNGASWNEADYHKAILSIYDNVIISDRQKIKLSKSESGKPLAMIYDCSQCQRRGTCPIETPVTLDDIRRIVDYLGITWEQFFREKLDYHFSTETGGLLKLKRNGHCVFFGQEEACTIEKVRPMHCRFTPCPLKTQTDEMMDCLFLGSGTVEEQFRHQVALAATRQYVSEYGTRYSREGIEKGLDTIDQMVSKHVGFDEFCRNIAHYRYVDDALLVLKQQEAALTA